MTIIPVNSEADHKVPPAAIKPLRVNGDAIEINNGYANGAISPSSVTNIAPPSPSHTPTTLVARFIEAYKELQSYK